MILPSTYLATLVLMIFSLLCWGSWANTLKLTGKWRFELFYFDFAFGVFVAAAIAAITFGSLGFDGFSFMDDMLHASKKQAAVGVIAGAVFNLGNMLMVSAVSLAGMTVVFPAALGTAMVVGVIWNFFLKPQGNAALLFAGAAMVFVAIILDSVAYRMFKMGKIDELVRTGQQKSTRRTVSSKGISLSIVGGLLMGSFLPLVEISRAGDSGLGPYSVGFVFAIGVLLSTFLFNLFFMNLPVSGPPIEVFDYFKGSWKQHVLGIAGGLLWYTGTIANFVAATAEGSANLGPSIGYALAQGATVLAAIWGIIAWKELEGADTRVRSLVFLMLALFVCGLGLVSVAPVWTRG
jgi:glucose uptake protein